MLLLLTLNLNSPPIEIPLPRELLRTILLFLIDTFCDLTLSSALTGTLMAEVSTFPSSIMSLPSITAPLQDEQPIATLPTFINLLLRITVLTKYSSLLEYPGSTLIPQQ